MPSFSASSARATGLGQPNRVVRVPHPPKASGRIGFASSHLGHLAFVHGLRSTASGGHRGAARTPSAHAPSAPFPARTQARAGRSAPTLRARRA